MPESTKINGVEYILTPLKMKHLRQINELVLKAKEEPAKDGSMYQAVAKFMPFIVDSIQVKDPSFDMQKLEEASIQEVFDTWQTLTNMSGIKIVSGEPKPASSIGSSSTGDSAPPPAGPTVM